MEGKPCLLDQRAKSKSDRDHRSCHTSLTSSAVVVASIQDFNNINNTLDYVSPVLPRDWVYDEEKVRFLADSQIHIPKKKLVKSNWDLSLPIENSVEVTRHENSSGRR